MADQLTYPARFFPRASVRTLCVQVEAVPKASLMKRSMSANTSKAKIQ